jgi:hypothetical protein
VIFTQDRQKLRQMYQDAWNKHRQQQVLTPLEAQIARVVEDHPEYQEVVTGDLTQEFTVEVGATNPFLHMGLHLGIREQVATRRPAGIEDVHTALVRRLDDAHAAEHRMIDCLAETLWEAQSLSRAPDEVAYLERLRRL